MNFQALGSRNFRIYFFGNIFALNATWMQRVTIGWLAWDMTGAASFVGLVALAVSVPTVLLGPVFGVLVDRVNVKLAALATQAMMLVVTMVLFATVTSELMSPVLLLVVALLSGTVVAAHNPVRMSLAPRLVPRDLLASVVNFTSINFNLARLLGPAIGGFGIGWLGVADTLLLQAAFYLPFIFAISHLTIRPRREVKGGHEPFWAALQSGLRHVLQEPLVRRAVVVTGAVTLMARGCLEILPVLADGVFDKGASGLGMLTSAAGGGALIGGLSKALLPPQTAGRLPSVALLSAWASVAMVPLLGIAPSWSLALLMVASIGFCTTITAVSMQTAIQLDLPDELRGRVMSLWIVIAMGGSAAGAGLLGLLVDLVGLSMALAGAGVLVASALGLFIVKISLRP